jgi:peptidoglycan/LPS O-acetylase OafA/YrhL
MRFGGTRTLGEACSGRDNNFNLIRMLAAFGVLVSHAYPISLGPGAPEPLQAALGGRSLGGISVAAFFVISGYFITQSFERSRGRAAFLAARALRLYPALAVVLVLTVVIGWLAFSDAPAEEYAPAAARYVARNLGLLFPVYELPGVFEANPYGPAINGSLWTLGFEALCYAGVFFAGVLGLLRRWLVLAALPLVLSAYAVAPQIAPPYHVAKLIELGAPFAVGAALYLSRDRVPVDGRIALALAAAAWALADTAAFGPAFLLALCYGVFWAGCLRSRVLGTYNRLGDYSYGAYIYAFPIQQIMAAQGVVSPLANIALATPALLSCAALSWVFVERPALTLKDAARTLAESGR